MSTPHVWRLIEQWLDQQLFRVSQAQLAEAVGVTRQAVSQWRAGKVRPSPEHLRQISRLTRIPFDDLTGALLLDMGYTELGDSPAEEQPSTNRQVPRGRAPTEVIIADGPGIIAKGPTHLNRHTSSAGRQPRPPTELDKRRQ